MQVHGTAPTHLLHRSMRALFLPFFLSVRLSVRPSVFLSLSLSLILCCKINSLRYNYRQVSTGKSKRDTGRHSTIAVKCNKIEPLENRILKRQERRRKLRQLKTVSSIFIFISKSHACLRKAIEMGLTLSEYGLENKATGEKDCHG